MFTQQAILQWTPAAGGTTFGTTAEQLAETAVSCGLNDGRSASQTERRTLRVALFEDNYWFGERIRGALLAWGFEVVWLIGATDTSTAMLQGITPDSPAGENKVSPLDAADVDIVFTDCMLVGPHSGVDVAQWCARHGVPAIGISGDHNDNRRIINAGAKLALSKELVSRAILAGLPVERLAKQEQPR